MALYHKHRPQNFSSVIGQEHIVKTITNQIATGKTAHAYLFSGPRGVGKTTLARLLAKAVNCEERKADSFEPCNKCHSCEEISHSRALDVIEIDAASHTGVDNVRENIIDNAQFKPTKSKFKVFIIDEVHMLSTSAFNALLKTLEEPPEYVIFILATTELAELPETIISRCQRFAFHKVDHDTLKKQLNHIAKEEGIKIDKEVVERIINKSDGCVRDAVSLFDQIMASGEKEITPEVASLVLPNTNNEKTVSFLNHLINKDLKSGIEFLNDLAQDGVDFQQFAFSAIELLRLLMINKATGKADGLAVDLSEKTRKELIKLADLISHLELVQLLDLILKRANEIKTAPLPQLPLEMAVIEWCSNDTDTRIYADDANHADDVKNKIETINTNPSTVVEEKKTITQKVKDLIHHTPAFTKEEIENKWNQFMQKLETTSPSLTFILKMANVIKVEGNVVEIGVGFSFHRDKIMEKTCRDNLENILSEVLGGKAKLEAIIQEQGETNTTKQELQDLASTLGGEVI